MWGIINKRPRQTFHPEEYLAWADRNKEALTTSWMSYCVTIKFIPYSEYIYRFYMGGLEDVKIETYLGVLL